MNITSRNRLARIEPLEARIAPAVIFAVTETNRLISFDSAAPGTLLSDVEITGLVAPGERLEAIDFRPATGELYGLVINDFDAGSDAASLYTINPLTAVATPIELAFTVGLEHGAAYGFDFDPVADVIRVVNDADQNLRVDPNTGSLVDVPDAPLSNPAAEENIYAIAYDRSVAGATASTLYGIEHFSDDLVRIGGVDGAPSPNGGAVTVIGSLADVGTEERLGGFDIEAGTGLAFIALDTGTASLRSVDLATGATTFLGTIGTDTTKIRGLAVAPPSDLTIAANGKSATFTDIDGDKVVVTTSAGALSAGQFTFGAVSALGRQLVGFKVASANFADAALTFTATPVAGKGDGFVAIGRIDATGFDLGKVTVDGDLGQVDAGDDADDDIALAALTVHSLGALGTSTQLPGGNLLSDIKGKLGPVTIKTDLLGARIEADSAGNVFIGGDLVGGNNAGAGAGLNFGPMGNLTVGGSIIGGSATQDGYVQATSIGKVTLGGSLLGGAGQASGRISTFGGPIGAVTIKGDIVGGGEGATGQIFAAGDIASVSVGGSLLGGTVPDPNNDTRSGSIRASVSIPGGVKIGGDVRGGNGDDGGTIFANVDLGPVTIGGALVGGAGENSGSIRTDTGSLAAVKIGGDVRSGTAIASGRIASGSSIASVTIGGSFVQTTANFLAGITADTTIGAVSIGGDVRGVDSQGALLYAFGLGGAVGGIKSITVKGSVVNADFGAGISNPNATIGAVKVGGDWIASLLRSGVNPAADNKFGTADDIKIAEPTADTIFSTIKSVTIGGYVMGTVGGTDHYGFVAERIGAMKIGGVKVPLTAGLDKVGFALGATGDVRVREIDATPAVFPAPTLPASDNPLIYAVDQGNNLITFRADAPGAILSTVAIGGLGGREAIAGLDFRPATGELYAFGLTDVTDAPDSGRLLRLDPATGAATAVGAPFSTTLAADNNYGFDFDPVADRIRVVSTVDANFFLHPDTGTAETDTPVTAGTEIYALAYDRNFRGGGATTLYGLAFSNSSLVRIGGVDGTPASPDGGVVTTIGQLEPGSDLENSGLGGFDIEARTGTAYAAIFDADPDPERTGLYTIDLTTGLATFVGAIGNGTSRMSGFTIAPSHDLVVTGKTATFTDIDGDLVTVKTNKGTLDASMFTFAPGLLGSQLLRLQISGTALDGADLTITATPDAGKGDGFVNVGHISTPPLGKVSVDGDLGRITTNGIGSLTAHSMGRFGTSTQLSGGSLESRSINLPIGRITLKTDLVNASITTVDDGTAPAIGPVFIGGSIVGGDAKTGLFAAGSIGAVKLGGSLVGGSVDESGKIDAGTTLGKVTLGGSLLGGTAADTGRIESSAGAMSAVTIRGEIAGGTQNNAGSIFAKGTLASATLGGSLVGGAGFSTGSITSDVGVNASLGPVKIGGSVLGGAGLLSASVSGGANLGAVSVGGSVVGGGDFGSGSIFGVKGIASVKIGRDLRGGAGLNSGSLLSSQGSIGAVTIGGSFAGIDAADTGIFSDITLGKVTIGGSLRGDTDDGVRIQAKGLLDPTSAAKAVAIAGLSVKGGVRNALVLAGYDDFNIDFALNPDAAIGAVNIGGNFLATSLIAGTARGNDGLFGTAADEKIVEPTADAIFSKIASLTVRGFATGTPGTSGDHFGLVAERMGKVKVGAATYALTEANRLTGLAVGTAGDLRLRGV